MKKVAIIGAGPAGLAAAQELVCKEYEISIIDSNIRSGGQYWRHSPNAHFPDSNFRAISVDSRINWYLGHSVWQIEKFDDQFRIHISGSSKSHSIVVDNLIIATGASERTLPFKNWTMPGVLTAGALQTLAKEHRVIPGNEIVICGSGIFAFPVAETLKKIACEIGEEISITIVEARSLFRWWRNLLGFLLNPSKIYEALSYLVMAKKEKVKIISRKVVVAAEIEDDGISGVRTSDIDKGLHVQRESQTLNCDLIATSFGFIPDMTIPSILGLQREYSHGNAVVSVDSHQRTSIANIWAAGEVTGIGGHELSITEGRLSALDVDRDNQSFPEKVREKLLLWRRFRQRIFAHNLAKIYGINSDWISWQDESVLICRCEEVTLREITDSVKEFGADSARSAKLFTRAGMGLCQGRVCQRNVQDITDRMAIGVRAGQPEKRDPNRETIRPVAGVVTLSELSD